MEAETESASTAKKPGNVTFLKLPGKWMKRMFAYLNPIDCYNLAQVNPKTLALVKKRNHLELKAVYVRFDEDRSCIAAYFDHRRYTGYVFYSWRLANGTRQSWTNTYYLRQHKMSSHMFNGRSHPKQVQPLIPVGTYPIDYTTILMENYKLLLEIFPRRQPYVQMGVNVFDKKACAAFANLKLNHIQSIRLFSPYYVKEKRVREALKNVTSYDSVRVAWRVGVGCMHPKVTNAQNLTLDDPEWLTRDQLLNLNCQSIDIGHNHLSPDDLNAFLMQWMFDEKVMMRCQRLEIELSPEAFASKKRILENLPVRDWSPLNREGEYFDVTWYLRKTRIRDPHHFLDCKSGKDLIRPDGRLATILFHARKMYFVVWQNRFPYQTLKRARFQADVAKIRAQLIQKLQEAVAYMALREETEWNQRLDAFEAEFTARKILRQYAESEERVAKRKYYEALQDFLDTSAPKPKRRLLRTITIFK